MSQIFTSSSKPRFALSTRSLGLLALALFVAFASAPAGAQEDDTKRFEVRTITKTCAGDECADDNHVVIELKGDSLKLPGLHELQVLGGKGENVFFYGGAGGGGFLGVQLVGLTEALRTHFGVPEGEGVMVSEVSDDTPAWRAGVTAGDVITAVDGRRVSSSGELSNLVRETEPGAAIDLEVWRDGAPMTDDLGDLFDGEVEHRVEHHDPLRGSEAGDEGVAPA